MMGFFTAGKCLWELGPRERNPSAHGTILTAGEGDGVTRHRVRVCSSSSSRPGRKGGETRKPGQQKNCISRKTGGLRGGGRGMLLKDGDRSKLGTRKGTSGEIEGD